MPKMFYNCVALLPGEFNRNGSAINAAASDCLMLTVGGSELGCDDASAEGSSSVIAEVRAPTPPYGVCGLESRGPKGRFPNTAQVLFWPNRTI